MSRKLVLQLGSIIGAGLAMTFALVLLALVLEVREPYPVYINYLSVMQKGFAVGAITGLLTCLFSDEFLRKWVFAASGISFTAVVVTLTCLFIPDSDILSLSGLFSLALVSCCGALICGFCHLGGARLAGRICSGDS